MVINLKYGRGRLPVEIPDSIDVELIEPPRLPVIESLRNALISSLESPVACPPLREILPASGQVAIIVSDRTRPCSYPEVLPLLLDYLNANGVPDNRVFLLVAYGAHRRHTDAENRSFYGEEALSRVSLLHHDCRPESGLAEMGRTSRGTEVRLNRRYIEAAASIVVASVSFHYFAGFGGGRKAVFPGLASEEGILNNHRIFVECGGGSLPEMRRFKANLNNNPLNHDLMEAVAMAPPSFVISLCMSDEDDVSGIFSGDWRESHRLACEFLAGTRIQSKRKYDLVIASCGGYPKDINFIQAHKTIDNAFDLLKAGGALVILASCDDGMGSSSFLQWFDRKDATSMRSALLKNYSMNGGTALALKLKADACPIFLHSRLDKEAVEKMGLHLVRNLRRDLCEIAAQVGAKSAAVLPEGAITVFAGE